MTNGYNIGCSLIIGMLLLMLFLWLSVMPQKAVASGLIYKNYIVRYDRGWDILCEPYVVQKNDWVLKIFRQKGEIAHADFKDFLGIFERLNPHIRNVDMVRPGQTIDIPLRKLEHGSLPGQASGIITIPFVTLSKVTDVVIQHSSQYKVQRGDTVSKLLAQNYGRYGSRSYQEGEKLFQAANPNIKNLDLILEGQKVYLPEPSIREQAWYPTLYDKQGELKQAIDNKTGEPISASNIPSSRLALPTPQAKEKSQGVLSQAAETLGVKLQEKGTYFVPRQDADDFEVDLSRHPMLDMQKDEKIIFTKDDSVMGVDPETVQRFWPEAKVVSYSDQDSVEQVVASIFKAIDKNGAQPESAEELTFNDNSVQVAVRAKWVRPESDQRNLCITPISAPEEKTPESMRRYLEQNGIIIKEILPGNKDAADRQEMESQRHAVKSVLALAPANQKEFVQSVAHALGFTLAPNISITFPYAGIQVKAYAHLLSTGKGQEILIDFGDLYGDAVEAIRKSGPQLVQITADEDYTAIVNKLFVALGLDFVENPTFFAAQRPAQFNTTITIPGILYAPTQDKQILLSAATLHPALTDMLSNAQVDVVRW